MSQRNGKRKAEPRTPDRHRLPSGDTFDKVEAYGWTIEDKPGRFQKVAKSLLCIDHDYQRDNVRMSRVNRIAARWSWVKLGVLLVARRPDGTFWVFDGQHRKLAADKRSDISDLPCMVYESAGAQAEAGLFKDCNDDRSSLQMLDKFKALLVSNDPVAEMVQGAVERIGYTIARSGVRYTLKCVGAVYKGFQYDAASADTAIQVAARVADGEAIIDRVFSGLWAADRHMRRIGMGTLSDAKWASALAKAGQTGIDHSIREALAYHGKGGERTFGEGVVRLLNKGRQNRIPSLQGAE